jgi:hypothetical protein
LEQAYFLSVVDRVIWQTVLKYQAMRELMQAFSTAQAKLELDSILRIRLIPFILLGHKAAQALSPEFLLRFKAVFLCSSKSP